MFRKIRIALVSIVLLVVLAIAAGAIWYLLKTREFLLPPDDPAGQPGLASRIESAPVPAPARPALVEGFDWESLASPPRSARAWTRWWWPGGDVDPGILQEQLGALDDAGFGGAEIQPFVGGMLAISDPATWERVYRFDTPDYYRTLQTLMAAAEARRMQLDLTHFSGWPPGGPEVNLADSNTLLAWSELRVSGGKTLDLALPPPRPGASEYMFAAVEFAGADFNNFPAAHARLLSVMAARPVRGEHAWSPLNLADTVALDPASVIVLDDKVRDGVLRWDSPAGEWIVVASWLMPSGEVPMGAAQKPQGFVLDHLREPVVLGHYAWAFGRRTGLAAHYGRGFRGFFNDSLEFRLKRRGVEDILTEFRRRRGYDLEPWLPAIHVEGRDNVYFSEIVGIRAAPEFSLTPQDDRIREDYQQTLSDLVIERFVEASARWAQDRGLVSRAQSYGMDIDILRALGANDIPEGEQLWAGGANAGLKFAASAAALYGKPLASAESFVWIQRDWTTTARKIKASADKLFLAGINHIVYHGTPYPWTGDANAAFGAEGWSPFSSVKNPAHFSSIVAPANTALWPDIADVNRYIARSQNLLRQGAPDVDVLVYYPFLGFHGANPEHGTSEALVNGSLPDADPPASAREDPVMETARDLIGRVFTLPPEQQEARERWVARLDPTLQALDRRGITWAWVNDHALQSGAVTSGGRLGHAGGRYQAILLPDVPMMPMATADVLGALAREGTVVVFAGDLPSRQPGFFAAHSGDRHLRERVQTLLSERAVRVDADAGSIVEALAGRIVQPVRHLSEGTIHSHRRVLGKASGIVLFANQDAAPATLDLQIPAADSSWWFDAMTGDIWAAAPVDGRLQLGLRGFESRFLIRGIPMPAGTTPGVPVSVRATAAIRAQPLDDWSLESDGVKARDIALGDWRASKVTAHAARGTYTTHVTVQQSAATRGHLLDLGLVQGSADVRVNGQAMGHASLPPFIVDVGAALHAGDNRIEIDVRAPLRNPFVGRALAGDPRYAHMKDYEAALVAAGLIGPVRLLEVAD